MPPEQVFRGEFYDCQDDLKLIGSYADIGVGPLVVFDGAGFTSPKGLRGFIQTLTEQADWLERAVASREMRRPDHEDPAAEQLRRAEEAT
jgi:hypothetical protein